MTAVADQPASTYGKSHDVQLHYKRDIVYFDYVKTDFDTVSLSSYRYLTSNAI